MDQKVKRATARFAKSPVSEDSKDLDMVPSTAIPAKKKLAPPGKGAYLFYDTGSNGQMLLIWSHEPVEGALAHFNPTKDVQAFKYNQNGGKVNLMAVRGDKKKYMEGVMQFIKQAHDYRAKVYVYENDDADVWYMDKDKQIQSTDHQAWFDTKDISVLAVMPRYSEIFKGVRSTVKDVFIDMASGNRGVTWQPVIRPKTGRMDPVNASGNMSA